MQINANPKSGEPWKFAIPDVISLLCALLAGSQFEAMTTRPLWQGFCILGILAPILYWLVRIRHRCFRVLPPRPGWIKTVRWLLVLSSILPVLAWLGLVVECSFFTNIQDWTGGQGLAKALGMVVLIFLAHTISLYLCAGAFLIQLWRGQWLAALTTAALALQAACFLLYVIALGCNTAG